MSELSYRVKTEHGLSEPHSLQTLQAEVASGRVQRDAQVTADDGDSWQTIAELPDRDGPDGPTEQPAPHSSMSASETTVRDSSETQPVAASRKLKRLPVQTGKSKYARHTESARAQKPTANAKLSALVGRRLSNGRYEVLSQFGSGSMAYVFRAADNRLETDVIIKVPKPEKITSDDFRERFRRESQLLVRLSHPHVVKVLDVGETEDLPYVVMQLLSGGTLLDRLREDCNEVNQMSPQSLQTWLREVARALDFCYRKGMVHRDVKPANILFDDDHNPYVSDFGLTKIMHGEHTELCSNGTANGVVLGTPNYLPPEIILGAPYDGRADQYSLALTVYHVLCGRPPMQGKSATATMINQTQKTLELLSSFRTDVPRELALAVQKGIEKQPANRFESCEAFADAVLECLRTDSSSEILLGGLNTAFARETDEQPSPRSDRSGPTNRRTTAGTTEQRVPSSRSGSGAQPSARREPAQQKSAQQGSARSSNSSRRNRPPATKNATRQNSSASSAQRSVRSRPRTAATEGLYDDAWLEPSPQQLPPRRGQRNRTKSRTSQEKPRQVVVFGMAMHPAALVIAAAMVLLPSTIFIGLWMASSSPAREQADFFVLPDDSGTPADPAAGQSAPNPAEQRDHNTEFAHRSFEDDDVTASTDGRSSPPSQPEIAQRSEGDDQRAAADGDRRLQTTSAPRKRIIAHRPGDPIIRGPVTSPRAIVGVDVWDLLQHQQIATLDGDYPATALTALSPDGRWFAAATKPPGLQATQVTVWDTNTGQIKMSTQTTGERFVDAIILSQDRLLLGDRWSDELLVWDLASGRSRRAVRLPQAKFKQGNTSISPDGKFLAAVVNDEVRVFQADDGTGVVALQQPVSVGRRREGSRGLYAGLQALAFSPDGQELAAITTVDDARFVCWNGRGEVVLESRPSGTCQPDDEITWFQGRRAWLIGDQVLDGGARRIVARVPTGPAGRSGTRLLDDNHLLIKAVTRPEQLDVVSIPWGDIQRSLNNSRADVTAVLRPDSQVAVHVRLSDSSESDHTALRRTLEKHVAALGLEVAPSADVVITLRVAKDEEQFVENRSLQWPIERRFGAPGERLTSSALVLEVSDRSQSAVWSAILKRDPLWLQRREGEPAEAVTTRLEQALADMAFPYYLPDDPQFLSLPVLLDSPSSDPPAERLATEDAPVRQ